MIYIAAIGHFGSYVRNTCACMHCPSKKGTCNDIVDFRNFVFKYLLELSAINLEDSIGQQLRM